MEPESELRDPEYIKKKLKQKKNFHYPECDHHERRQARRSDAESAAEIRGLNKS